MDIFEYLKNNPITKPIYKKVRQECFDNNCQSINTMVLLTIERLADEIQRLREDLYHCNSELQNTRNFIVDNNLQNDLNDYIKEKRK
jgi:hypothetical protein